MSGTHARLLFFPFKIFGNRRARLDLRSFCQRSEPATRGNTPSPPIRWAVLAFGAGITPPPGTYVTNAISFYSGNIGGTFDFGGRTFNAGVKADIFLDSTNILLVPQGKFLDGNFGASVTVPAGYVKYDASASGALGANLH